MGIGIGKGASKRFNFVVTRVATVICTTTDGLARKRKFCVTEVTW